MGKGGYSDGNQVQSKSKGDFMRGEAHPVLSRSQTTPVGDWFTQLFGFEEGDYEDTQRRLKVTTDEHGKQLIEGENGRKYKIGRFWTPSLAELEAEANKQGGLKALPGKLKVRNVSGDISARHAQKENCHSTIQVASQFNCLEFIGPQVVPERGITGYKNDRTQGPACSITCGPATAYRNYFAEVDGQDGQTHDVQIDNLRDLSQLIGNNPDGTYYKVIGGYTMANKSNLQKLNLHMHRMRDAEYERIRRSLRIGIHEDVQVTATNWGQNPMKDDDQTVTQVFGSACSVSYSGNGKDAWESFASMILSASYEATLWTSLLTALRHGSDESEHLSGPRRVFLTCLGGGVFGNSMEWITQAMEDALQKFKDVNLEICIVTYGSNIPEELRVLEDRYRGTKHASRKK